MEFLKEKIAGIETFFVPMNDTNSITIEIFVRAGNIYEERETNGISHFLEHMFFKGGKKYTTPAKVAEAVDQFGGEFNAYTGDEYAGYYVKCAPEYATKAMDVLADMLVNPQFPKDEMEREKGVVIQEIKMYEDMPQRMVMNKRKQFYYGDNSYGRSILGPVENISSFTQDHLFQHKENLYTKDNLIIVVAGKIQNKDTLVAQIGELFNALPSSAKVTKPKFTRNIPNNKVDFYDKKTEQNHLVFASNGFTVFQDEQYVANILGVMLGGNMSSRLFQNIREKQGLCYYISGSHSPDVEDGLYMIRAGIEKARFDFGVDAIHKEIAKLGEGTLTQDEFKKALGYLSGKTQMGIETSDQMSDFIGSQYITEGIVESLDQILSHYHQVEFEQVVEFGEKLANQDWYLYYIK